MKEIGFKLVVGTLGLFILLFVIAVLCTPVYLFILFDLDYYHVLYAAGGIFLIVLIYALGDDLLKRMREDEI